MKKFCNKGFNPFPFCTTISEETGSKGLAIKLDKIMKNEKINVSIKYELNFRFSITFKVLKM